MNQMHNNFNQVLTKFTRIPMRHTFTMDQKAILLKCFEEGMVGQSMAYHDKIAQCSQKTGLDFDTVKNWVGNQRRKRRMEEVQSMTIYAGQEHLLEPSSSQLPIKYQRTAGSHSGPQKPIQVLYFPRSSGGTVNLQGGPVDTSVSCSEPSSQYSQQGPPHSQMVRPAYRRGPASIPLRHGSPDTRHHHMNLNHSHIKMSVPPETISNHRLRSPVRIFTPRQNSVSPRAFVYNRNHPPADGMNISLPANMDGSESQVGPSRQNPRSDHTNQGPRGVYRVGQVSPNGQHYFSDGSPQSTDIPGHLSRDSLGGFDEESSMSPSVDDHESEWKEIQIQKIVETIQIYVDQLNKLSCEAFLASVSRDTLSTYLCGTALGNSYFTDVNKDQPFSEFVESELDNTMNAEANAELDGTVESEANPQLVDSEIGPDDRQEVDRAVNSEEHSEEHAETGCADDQKKGDGEAEDEKTNEDTAGDGTARLSECMATDGGASRDRKDGDVIRSGEEVYIINKEYFIIGRGTLLPAPHQKIIPKSLPKQDNADHINGVGEDGFMEEVEDGHS